MFLKWNTPYKYHITKNNHNLTQPYKTAVNEEILRFRKATKWQDGKDFTGKWEKESKGYEPSVKRIKTSKNLINC